MFIDVSIYYLLLFFNIQLIFKLYGSYFVNKLRSRYYLSSSKDSATRWIISMIVVVLTLSEYLPKSKIWPRGDFQCRRLYYQISFAFLQFELQTSRFLRSCFRTSQSEMYQSCALNQTVLRSHN